ncbi:MAG: RNA-binding domain-containing protein [Halolamina sp.]
MIFSVDVRIEAPVRDTEVTDRVDDAVANLFPDVDLHHEPGTLVAESHSLDRFSDVLHEQEILDTARQEFRDGVDRRDDGDDPGFDFRLKKQAAYEGVVNFAVGSEDELGDIAVDVTVREPSVEEFIDHVAPPTEEGTPVDPEADREEFDRR